MVLVSEMRTPAVTMARLFASPWRSMPHRASSARLHDRRDARLRCDHDRIGKRGERIGVANQINWALGEREACSQIDYCRRIIGR
jgi:hypothetical protein